MWSRLNAIASVDYDDINTVDYVIQTSSMLITEGNDVVSPADGFIRKVYALRVLVLSILYQPRAHFILITGFDRHL